MNPELMICNRSTRARRSQYGTGRSKPQGAKVPASMNRPAGLHRSAGSLSTLVFAGAVARVSYKVEKHPVPGRTSIMTS
jgi:hypothetical protein